MAKKDAKKVSITTLDEIQKKHYPDTIIGNWNDVKIEVTPVITFSEMVSFVSSVVESCIDDDDGAYYPELYDFAIKSNVVLRYSNVSLPDNLEHRYKLLYQTDFYNYIFALIDKDQINAIMTACDEKIAYLNDSNITEIKKKVSELNESFDEVSKLTDKFYENLSQDDIKNITSALNNGEIDEEKIVRAFLNTNAEKEEQIMAVDMK